MHYIFMWVASIFLCAVVTFVVHFDAIPKMKHKRGKKTCSGMITTLIRRTLINYIVIKRPDCSQNTKNYDIIKREKVVNLAQKVHHLHEKLLHSIDDGI